MANSRTFAQRAQQQSVLGIIRTAPLCLVTVVTETGRLVSQPMTPQQVTEAGDVWFVVDLSSEHVRRAASPRPVNLAFGQGSGWLSASGRGHVVRDAAKVRRLWDADAEARFPDGPDDPTVGLLRVHMRAEHWDGAASLADRDTPRSLAALRRPQADHRMRPDIRARRWCARRARGARSAWSCPSRRSMSSIGMIRSPAPALRRDLRRRR
jgi:general stress protein 26